MEYALLLSLVDQGCRIQKLLLCGLLVPGSDSGIHLLDGGLDTGLDCLVPLIPDLCDQNTLFSRLDVSQLEHLQLMFRKINQ